MTYDDNAYLQQVEALEGAVEDLLNNEITPEQIKQLVNDAIDNAEVAG